MKITLDITRLVEEGKLMPAEAERLKTLASHDTGALGINILIAFGVVAVAVGAVALVPTPLTAVLLGAVMFGLGCALVLNRVEQWSLLGQITLVIGALMFCGGVIVYGEGSLTAMLIVTFALAGAAILARASLLSALAVLAASACLGARTGYSYATYSLAIFEPTLTVVLFAALALVTFLAAKRLPADYERIALAAARTSIFLINFGFWVGSLWGDPLLLLRRMDGYSAARFDDPLVPAGVFSIGWAIVLIGAGVWAVRVNRRWLVNVVAVFAAIHFYTQWFERLGASPLTVLLGGVLLLLIALALWAFNRRTTAVA